MKKPVLSCLMIALVIGVIHVPAATSATPYGRSDDRWTSARDHRDLQGTWYVNGARNQRGQIVSSRRGLQAVNERGHASRLEVARNGTVRALDWHGLRGSVRRDRIEWANGTTWTRAPSSRSLWYR